MASATEYMYEINELNSKIDTLTNNLNNLDKTDTEFLSRKSKLAYTFKETFGTDIGKLPFLKFSVISNLENRLNSDKQVESITKTELNEEIKILTNKCRTFKNMLVGRKR